VEGEVAESKFTGFYERVARYQRARGNIYGFEELGDLGRPYRQRPVPRKPVRVIICVFAVMFALAALKAGTIVFVGEGIFADHVAKMSDAQSIERLGAAFLMEDPLSNFLVGQIHIWMPTVKDFVISLWAVGP
jgi:hypothetical protein